MQNITKIRLRPHLFSIVDPEIQLELDRIGFRRIDLFEWRALQAPQAAGNIGVQCRVSGSVDDRHALDPARRENVDLQQNGAFDAGLVPEQFDRNPGPQACSEGVLVEPRLFLSRWRARAPCAGRSRH